MMVPRPGGPFGNLLRYRGTELPRIQSRVLRVFAFSCVVTFVETHVPDEIFHSELSVLPFQLVGVAISIFLGFRNNTAYDRWWEGRKLWGSLVNTSRTFARQSLTLIGSGPERAPITDEERTEIAALQKALVYRMIAFVHALRMQLRDSMDVRALEPFLAKDEVTSLASESNVPSAISKGTADRIAAAWSRGWIHPMHVATLEASLTVMTDIHGACERIKSSPIPFSYTTLTHRIVSAYCYGLPFGIATQLGALTPIVTVVVAYAFFGLDTIGDEIEQPFGSDDNDLPLDAMARMIEVNLRQRVGESELPPLLQPVDEYLG